MSTEMNQQLLREFVEEVWNRGRLERIPDYVSSDYVLHHPSCPIRGVEALAGMIAQYRVGFPDLDLKVEEMLADGDRLAVRYTLIGTHYGTLSGFEPSGRSVTIPGLSLVRWVDGKQQEEWSQWDSSSALQQIGALTDG